MSVREITDEEVASYQENGWVKLDGLLNQEQTEQLLKAGEARVEDWPGEKATSLWKLKHNLARDGVDPFRSLVFSETMGRNTQRLVNRQRLSHTDVPVRYLEDILVCKRFEDTATHYHQDHQYRADRLGSLMFWIALAEATPEMGTMRFLTGSHREGPLGVVRVEEDIIDRYPKLPDLYEWSPPLHYKPGDATAHHGCMVHGSLANTTDRPRWAYRIGYGPADALRGPKFDVQPYDDDQNPIVFTT